MAMVQSELFPIANKQEIERTKFWLKKYVHMISLMRDYERYMEELQQVAIDGEVARRIDQEDLHADKTVNAVVLLEKQRWVYEQYKLYVKQIQRAIDLIQDDETNAVINYRYTRGFSVKETVLHYQSIMSESTIKRKLIEGTESIANTLKLLGFFEQVANEF